MPKKKKPTLKSSVNRGFATTSTPSKKAETVEPETNKETAKADSISASSDRQEAQNGVSKPKTANESHTTGQSQIDASSWEADSEEAEWQALVERVEDKAAREVTRLWKAIEYDGRLSETLLGFDLDDSIRQKASSSTSSDSLQGPSADPLVQNEVAADSSATFLKVAEEHVPLPNTLLDSDKLFVKALTTLGLLQNAGFTRRQAEQALKTTSSPYDLEDCISCLITELDDVELGRAERRRRKIAADDAEEEDNAENKRVRDDSIPPEHPAYSFARSIGSKRDLQSSTKSQGGKNSKDTKVGSQTEVSEEEALGLTQQLRGLSISGAVLLQDLEDLISKGASGEGPLDTLEQPSLAWASSRLGQIKLDRLLGQQKKLLRSGANTSASIDAAKSSRVSSRLSEVMRSAERQRDFDRDTSAELLRRSRQEWEDLLKQENEASKTETESEDADGSPEGDSKTEDGTAAAAEPTASTNDSNETEQPEELAAEEGDADMFGGLLDETPPEIKDESSGISITVRPLPKVKSGRTPRSLLADSLRRLDPASSCRFVAVPTGGRAYRSRLTLRWPGREGKKSAESFTDVFELTGEGTESQESADDMLATLALSCIERDAAIIRGLSGKYRDWYDEIERFRKAEKSAQAIEVLKRVKCIIQPRLDEVEARKEQVKAAKATTTDGLTNGNGKVDLGALASTVAPSITENAAESQRELFDERRQSKPYQKMLQTRQNLPIYQYRQHILDTMQQNQIFVLSGETGCGKSTQLPAYILEHCMSEGKPCKIYCTEPRRISAISLAERVSQELGEARGAVGGDDSLVGYAIRLDSHIGKQARLVYATSGILLRMLEGTSINEVTHIILDEVHERSIESDFLLIILKTLLQHRKDLKVILMSATLDAERLSAYCGGCPTVAVPGRTFPVQVNYLEDAVQLTDYTIEDDSQYAIKPRRDRSGRKVDVPGNKANLQSTEDDEGLLDDDDDDFERDGRTTSFDASGKERTYSRKTIGTLNRMDEYVINHDLIISLLERICFSPDLEQFSSAILVFMPGIADIRKLNDLLLAHKAFGSNSFIVSPLHSTLSSEDQSAVFNIPPKGIRKIVISTNIAETGVTIPDVTTVIDSGKHREMRFDEKRQISRLVDCFIAKSNAKQRRGRAGRVQEGLAFHLFTKQRHDKWLADHPLPEMLRLSLQDLALKLKIMKIRVGSSIADALAQALDPPTPVNVQRAVNTLIEVKALTTTEDITPLGRHLARIPLDVHMGKFLLTATLFRCLDAALTIAAALNSKSPFVTPFGREHEADLAKASFRVGNSDFLTIANAFNSWRRAIGQKHHFSFCRKSFLSHQTLQQIEELRQQYMAFLLDSGFAQVDEASKKSILNMRYRGGGGGGNHVNLMETPFELDSNGNSIAAIHCALSIGLYPKFLAIDPRSYQLRTIGNNQPTSIHPSSINFRLRLGDLPRTSISTTPHHLVYFTMVQSKRLYAREVAPIPDAALVLLCGNEAEYKFTSNCVHLDRNRLRFRVENPKSLLAIKALRETVLRAVNASYRSPGRPWTREQKYAFDVVMQAVGVGANEADSFSNGFKRE